MREDVQNKLNETSIECGNFRADEVLERDETYFGYQLTNNFVNSDIDSTYEMSLAINGYVARLEDATENTLEIIDKATKEIIDKLKELGFRTTYEDVSIDNGVRKIHITGNSVAQDNIIIGGVK
jgi:hypothetical protein